MKKNKKQINLFLAAILCITMLGGTGITANAASYNISTIGKNDIIEAGDTIIGNCSLLYGTPSYISYSIFIDNTKVMQVNNVQVDHLTGSYYCNEKLICHEITTQLIPAADTAIYQYYFKTVPDTPASEAPTAAAATSEDKEHQHSFSWIVTTEPTESSDGETAYMCTGCGLTEAVQPISGGVYILNEYKNLLENAPQNGTVYYEAGNLACISDYMLKKYQNCSEVTLVINFTYEGTDYQLTIPSGTDLTALLNDSESFYGYFGLAQALGLTVTTR